MKKVSHSAEKSTVHTPSALNASLVNVYECMCVCIVNGSRTSGAVCMSDSLSKFRARKRKRKREREKESEYTSPQG